MAIFIEIEHKMTQMFYVNTYFLIELQNCARCCIFEYKREYTFYRMSHRKIKSKKTNTFVVEKKLLMPSIFFL